MRIAETRRGAPLTIIVDGVAVAGFAGETVAALMLAGGIVRFRDDRSGQPRGLWCNMGTCGECTVAIDGRRLRACLAAASDGMVVATDG